MRKLREIPRIISILKNSKVDVIFFIPVEYDIPQVPTKKAFNLAKKSGAFFTVTKEDPRELKKLFGFYDYDEKAIYINLDAHYKKNGEFDYRGIEETLLHEAAHSLGHFLYKNSAFIHNKINGYSKRFNKSRQNSKKISKMLNMAIEYRDISMIPLIVDFFKLRGFGKKRLRSIIKKDLMYSSKGVI